MKLTLDEAVKIFDAKKNGKGYVALCPVHGDKNPSLSIDEGDNGYAVFICRSHNCKYEDILKAKGIEYKPEEKPKEKLEKGVYTLDFLQKKDTYIYKDESGSPLFLIQKYYNKNGKKSFAQYTPVIPGGYSKWKKGNGGKKTIYRLPEVLRAKKEGKTIFIVEGEKDADTLNNRGLTATTNPCGAGNWQDEYSKHLKDANVVMLPDQDVPGKKHEKKVVLSLQGIAKEIKVVNLDKKDVTEWFEAGHEKEELLNIVNNTAIHVFEESSKKEISIDKLPAEEDIILQEFTKDYFLANLNGNYSGNGNFNPYDTYLVFNANKNFMALYSEKKNFISPFKNLMNQEFIPKFEKISYDKDGNEIKKPYNFQEFWQLLDTSIHKNDSRLKIKHYDTSNLSILKDGKFYLSSDLSKQIIISKDFQNIEYNNLTENIVFSQDVEDEIDKLYTDQSLLIKAQIISSMVNEESDRKHLLLLSGSSVIGKSSTAHFIYSIVNNDLNYDTLKTQNLEKMWKKFFSKRITILDNLDVKSIFTEDLCSDLCQVITSPFFTADERYSVSGKSYQSNTYPIITTILTDLLESSIFTTLRSRTININLAYNEYAKDNLDKLKNNKEFTDKARLHFYYQAMEYLKVKDTISLPKDSPRSKNFFKVLTWLDKDYTRDFIYNIAEGETFGFYTTHFLNFLRQKSFLQGMVKNAATWTEEFNNYLQEIEVEPLKGNNILFKKYINPYLKSDLIAEFKLSKDKPAGRKFKFDAIAPSPAIEEQEKRPAKSKISHKFEDDTTAPF